MDNPFTITLYDKTLSRTGWVNDFDALVVNLKHMAVGSATITVPADHRRLALMQQPGARAVIEFNGEQIMSGYLTSGTLTLPLATGQAELTLTDDLNLMWRMLGWPVPGADLLSQGTKQDTRTGTAEAVAKGFVAAQLAHNTVDPITVAASLGRGATITVSSRMMPLADQLTDAVDKAGIGLSARQDAAARRIVFDAYTPQVYGHTLSERAGTILSGTLSWAGPTVTRTITGGPDTDTSREFRQSKDAALEALYGYTVETLTDAQSSTSHAEQDAAGAATLATGGPTTGVQLALSESSIFTYGGPDGVHVGDRVPIDLGGGNILTDVLREASLSFTRDDGLTVTPTIGDRSDDTGFAVARLLASLVRGLRTLRTR